eukprot:381716-Rhodomonas_salina.2
MFFFSFFFSFPLAMCNTTGAIQRTEGVVNRGQNYKEHAGTGQYCKKDSRTNGQFCKKDAST